MSAGGIGPAAPGAPAVGVSRPEGLEARIARVMDAHFDPRWGSPWWLEQARALGFDPRREIRTAADLDRLPPVPREALARRPVEDFLPRRHHARRAELVISETGGTTGPPARTVFLPEDFESAFVAPFVAAAERVGFPRGRSWLFAGPSGPHVIGKAACACARALGAMEPFAVDLDPRWARRLPAGSLARRRYTDHVLAQAVEVMASQDVGVIFGTPPLVAALGARLDRAVREVVTGIHLGGMPATAGFLRRLADDWFPHAVALSGYGNSLTGMCPEMRGARAGPEAGPAYFPHGERLVLEVVAPDPATGRGRVRFHRLDPSGLLPGVVERDEAAPARRPDGDTRFAARGIRDPRPPAANAPAEGLY